MKHKLLSLLALAGAMCMSTGAMAWDYPTMPAALEAPATYDGTWATPTADGQYYIYNVGTGLFLGGGQTWGTRGIALCDSVVLTSQEPVTINNTSGNTTANYVLPFELISGSNEGEWYLNVLNNSKATGGAGHFVGEDGAQAWIDGDESRNTSFGTWTMEATEEGYLIKNYYASQSKYTDAPVAFGIDGNNIQAGWAFTWTDLLVTSDASTKTRPYLVWKFVDASNGEAVRTYCQSYAKAVASEEYQAKLAAYKAAIAAFNAKFDLKEALEEADEAGVSTDAAAAVYNNADATEEEVKAATETLKAAIVSSQYDFSGASEDNPLDITDQVLENPDFETNYVQWQLPEGWEITITAQNKCGQESAGQVDEEKGYVHIEHFIEAWNPSALGDGDIRQTVYGLPSGKYVLECDAFTGQNATTFEGVYIFIEHASGVVTTPINTPSGQPMHFAVTFVNPDPASTFLRFGLRVKGTNANWIGADNFKLYYYGESTETQESLSLKDAIKKGNEANGEGANSDIDNSSSNNFSKEARATLTNAIANGESALSGTAEEMTAATEAIYNAIEALKTSMATYAQYQAIYADANLKLDEIPSKWSSLTSAIEDWMDAMAEGFSAGSLNEETLATDKNQLAIIIREALANGLEVEAGDDLTFLLVNPGFTQGTTTDPTGWTINSGSMTELRDATDNIETYHQAFDLSQTLP
ncbi:MAG: DUF5013 domain-containing protein, partial [Bacteroidales bacterium]|nr:DUF5013 domain-containing protein [Bacteroidales bacterium]